MSRVLAIDYGTKRTGIAVTDPLQMIANGLTTVKTHELSHFLANYLQKEDVAKIIVGLPKKMNNEPSESFPQIQMFVNKFTKNHPDVPIEYLDERFTSKMAFQTMIDGGLGKKARRNKSLVDEISATILLQSYLEMNSK